MEVTTKLQESHYWSCLWFAKSLCRISKQVVRRQFSLHCEPILYKISFFLPSLLKNMLFKRPLKIAGCWLSFIYTLRTVFYFYHGNDCCLNDPKRFLKTQTVSSKNHMFFGPKNRHTFLNWPILIKQVLSQILTMAILCIFLQIIKSQ